MEPKKSKNSLGFKFSVLDEIKMDIAKANAKAFMEKNYLKGK